MLLVVSGLFLLSVGSTDCVPFLLSPSTITASGEYSNRFPVENILDGRYDTIWASNDGPA